MSLLLAYGPLLIRFCRLSYMVLVLSYIDGPIYPDALVYELLMRKREKLRDVLCERIIMHFGYIQRPFVQSRDVSGLCLSVCEDWMQGIEGESFGRFVSYLFPNPRRRAEIWHFAWTVFDKVLN